MKMNSDYKHLYDEWTTECKDFKEMNEEKYSQYIVDIITGKFYGSGYNWVFLLAHKLNKQSIDLCKELQPLAKRYKTKQFRFVVVDE